MLKVKFWGVRGSLPVPGAKTIQMGGNTSCIEIINDKKELLIIDGGTGIRNLGNYIMQHYFKQGLKKCSILFTHTHWDHIQGFPFFTPIYLNNFEINLYGPARKNESFEDIIAGQMNYPYYPIKLSDLKATINFKDVTEEPFKIDTYLIKPKILNHPVKTYGYRIQYGKNIVTTLFDHEVYRNVVLEDNLPVANDLKLDSSVVIQAAEKVKELNQKIVDFVNRSDILIYDSHFTEKEYYAGKQGWGHGPAEFIIKESRNMNIRQYVLYHHAPEKSDHELIKMKENLEIFANSLDSKLNLIIAKEGLELTL